MTTFIPIYAPAKQHIDVLRRIHVGRQPLLDTLEDSIVASARGKTVQHWMLIGPRGLGKSHLVCLLYGRLRKRGDDAVFPVLMPEEGTGIVALGDFMERVVQSLLAETEDLGRRDQSLEAFCERLEREPDKDALAGQVSDFLAEWTGGGRRKIVLFVENLDRIWGERVLKKKAAETWLRSFLMNDPNVILIGTAVAPFANLDRAGSPLYQLFRIEYLEDFAFDEFRAFLIALAREAAQARLREAFERDTGRLRALYQLTGGNPRVALVLFDVLSAFGSVRDVEAAFFKHMNLLTPYFQERLARLTAQQEQILVAFAGADELLSPSEVARATRIGRVNVVTAQLSVLERHGFIRRAGAEAAGRRRKVWVLAEKVFRLWNQYQNRRGRKLVELFVEFIAWWYRSPELARERAAYARVLESAEVEDARSAAARTVEYLDLALETRCRIESRIRDEVVWPLLERGQFDEALAATDELGDSPEDCFTRGTVNLMIGEIRREADPLSRACVEFEQATRNRDDFREAFNNWGTALSELARLTGEAARYEEAFEKYERAVAIKPDTHEAFNSWGTALGELARLTGDAARYEQAFEKYERAVAIKPDTHEALYNWGNDLGELARLTGDAARYEEAFEKYERAVAIKPDTHEAFNNWGNALGELARLTGDAACYEEAFEKYERAVAIKRDKHEAFYNWGNALAELARLTGDAARYAEAFEKYERAVAIKPDTHEAFHNWGYALVGLARLTGDAARYAEAFEKYERAVAIEPDKHEALNNWGNALGGLARLTGDAARYEEAFEKYERAVAIKPDMHEALNNWGNVLGDLARLTSDAARFGEAFEKYERAVAIKPDLHEAFYNWGNALEELARRTGEGQFAEQALDKFARCAAILRRRDRFDAPLDFRDILRWVGFDRTEFRTNFAVVTESLAKLPERDNDDEPVLQGVRLYLYGFLIVLIEGARLDDAEYAVGELLATEYRPQLAYLERFETLFAAIRSGSKQRLARLMPEEREIFEQLYDTALAALKKNTPRKGKSGQKRSSASTRSSRKAKPRKKAKRPPSGTT